ncbi:hypothetical protein ASC75_24905 [Aminobacter sp. DSM 101952]|uniref:HEPN domain-containing protein n=1 Tax=unclassified Aminobacter TaxID=2644704 RepID=UPI0006F8DF29|nr:MULTISPECIES: HEPN domain-containing protein [unclassified Aminobacter]AWC22459.1 hypothetical protein CO731_01923 [Aminobacter sp. MSH1]KQU69676.1 hypothetical protein ASC75_24905 [Aminobacter sp. DSM 101952]
MKNWTDQLPLYGCLTGIELPDSGFEVIPGVSLRSVFVDMFGTSLLAFAPPPTPKAPHPGPWVPINGGYTFKSRVQVSITDVSSFDSLSPSAVAWLVAAMLRLQLPSPVRMAVLAAMPFDKMEVTHEPWPITFESATHQVGPYRTPSTVASEEDFLWLRTALPVASRLYHEERFFRAFSVYDQAQWSPTLEMGTVLVWTAIEALFDLGGEREKTKAICRALADYVSDGPSDRDRAFQVIRDMYGMRGSVVHNGGRVAPEDAIQSYQFAKVAFRRCIIDGKLPPSPQRVLQ